MDPARPVDFSDCLLMNTVMAARTLVRRYDAALKPFGVTVQQFTVLAVIRYHPDRPVAGLAERIAMERTSLIRNLDLLQRKGLVRRLSRPKGNARICRLTPEGDALLDRLIPEWQRAQAEIRALLEGADTDGYLDMAKRLIQG